MRTTVITGVCVALIFASASVQGQIAVSSNDHKMTQENGVTKNLANPPPDSITINWDPSRNVESDVKYIAERHCLVWDEHAEAVRDETRGTTHSTEFVCKGPLLR